MPVVRELINRISFKINPADKANAEKTFSLMKTGAKGVITAVAGITAAGTKLFNDFEKDTGTANFFARNKEEAELFRDVLDDIAQKSETVSQREARRAAKTLQQTRLTKEQVESLVPFLEKISVARPDLDFADVAERLKDAVSGADLDAFTDLIPGFKDTAELLSKASFAKPFGDITDLQRGEILLEALGKSRKRLNELVEEQKKTQAFQFEAVQESLSDFTLKFGTETAPAITELLREINTTIDMLNESESFWESVKETVTAISKTIRDTRLFFAGEENIELAAETEVRREEARKRGDIVLTDIPTQISEGVSKTVGETKIVLDGAIRVVNETGMELVQMGEDLTNQIFDQLGTTFKNITAANGGVVNP